MHKIDCLLNDEVIGKVVRCEDGKLTIAIDEKHWPTVAALLAPKSVGFSIGTVPEEKP